MTTVPSSRRRVRSESPHATVRVFSATDDPRATLMDHLAFALVDRTERLFLRDAPHQLIIVVTAFRYLGLLHLEHEHGVDGAAVLADLDRAEQRIVDLGR